MTVGEKRTRLDELCASHPGHCSKNGVCPLFHGAPDGVSCNSKSPKDIEQLYEIAFANETVINPVNNPVTNPAHYTQGNIQCIDAMVAAFGNEVVAHWCKCNAFKYIWREAHKNGMEDIDKAIWYLNKFKELSASG